MKSHNIFLVRHGESVGNVNKSIYNDLPDYALELTEKGREQADNVGKELSKIIPNNESVHFYVSSLWRTRQTFLQIQKYFNNYSYYEDPRLREQEWCTNLESTEEYRELIEEYRDNYGSFYYRFIKGGESCADVYDRVSDFLNTLYRDFEKPDFPRNVIIVSHGMAIRVFLMRFFHCSVEEFETWRNPKNCEYFKLELNEATDKYTLVTPLKIYLPIHKYQFDWKEFKSFSTKKLPTI